MEFRSTARALVFDNLGNILLLRRSASDPCHAGNWDLPGGHIEDHEDVMAAAKRETLEEAGIILDNPKLVFGTSDMRPSGGQTWIFFAETFAARPKVTLSWEHDQYIWAKFAELPNYTAYGILLRMHEYLTQNGLV